MSDDIRRWSDELASDPSSTVFIPLGEALRRQGQGEIALKIALRGLERHPRNADAHDLVARLAVDRRDFARAAREWSTVLELAPTHVGAMKGLGYLSFQQGKFEDAEAFLGRAAASGGGADVSAALDMVRRSSGGVAMPAEPMTDDPQRLFADLLSDDGQTALLLDGSGYVLAGLYVDSDGTDVSQEVGAQLSGISEEVERATHHLGLGAWKAITFETQVAVVSMAPAADRTLLVVAASRATPLGLLRRLVGRCVERVAGWSQPGGAA